VKSYYDKRIVGCPGGEGGKFFPSSNFSRILWTIFNRQSLLSLNISRHIIYQSNFLLKTAEDEHDVVWFWLEKGKSFECPVCTQYFEVSESRIRYSTQ